MSFSVIRLYHAARRVAALSILCPGRSIVAYGVHRSQKVNGYRADTSREFAVESRAPLTIPPDFDLRPPSTEHPDPRRSADQQAKQLIEQAGPGEPGKQASDFRLRRTEDGLPDTGRRSAQAPDPNGTVGDQSLSSKLLGASDASGAVDKRETTPLKGVY